MGLVCSWQKSPRWFGAVFLLAFSGAVIWTSQQYIFIEHLLYARHCSACWRLSRTVCSFHIYDLTEFEYRGRALHWEPNSGFSCDFACPTSLHWLVFLVLCSLHHDILFFLNVESALGRWKSDWVYRQLILSTLCRILQTLENHARILLLEKVKFLFVNGAVFVVFMNK